MERSRGTGNVLMVTVETFELTIQVSEYGAEKPDGGHVEEHGPECLQMMRRSIQ